MMELSFLFHTPWRVNVSAPTSRLFLPQLKPYKNWLATRVAFTMPAQKVVPPLSRQLRKLIFPYQESFSPIPMS